MGNEVFGRSDAVAAVRPEHEWDHHREGNFTDRLTHAYDRLLELDFFGDYNDRSDFWNYGYWREGTKSQRQACENLMEKLLGFVSKQGTILDVACGKGATTRYLLKYYKSDNIVGINISEKQLRLCRKIVPGCTFLLMDAAHLGFDDNSFDNIICVEAACHFDTRDKFLREAYRVLKPAGRLVLSDPILSLRSSVQPPANYLQTTSAYKQVCLRAGFSNALVIDATNKCFGTFSENLTHYIHEKFLSGEVGVHCFYGALAWLRRLGVERYILAVCEKR
jgi:ubiquinone/menaquinone biosynthesis C-methylase UbiE